VSYRQVITVVVIIAVAVVAVQPARADADPLTLLVVAGAAVVVAFYSVVAIELIRGQPLHDVDKTPPDTARDRNSGETP
jgi:drug/metabolite transporter (DMT)-like permease